MCVCDLFGPLQGNDGAHADSSQAGPDTAQGALPGSAGPEGQRGVQQSAPVRPHLLTAPNIRTNTHISTHTHTHTHRAQQDMMEQDKTKDEASLKRRQEHAREVRRQIQKKEEEFVTARRDFFDEGMKLDQEAKER